MLQPELSWRWGNSDYAGGHAPLISIRNKQLHQPSTSVCGIVSTGKYTYTLSTSNILRPGSQVNGCVPHTGNFIYDTVCLIQQISHPPEHYFLNLKFSFQMTTNGCKYQKQTQETITRIQNVKHPERVGLWCKLHTHTHTVCANAGSHSLRQLGPQQSSSHSNSQVLVCIQTNLKWQYCSSYCIHSSQ